MQIGVIAPCSQVPQIELELGVAKMTEAGFTVKVHPQCRFKEFVYAGKIIDRLKQALEVKSDGQPAKYWCFPQAAGCPHRVDL